MAVADSVKAMIDRRRLTVRKVDVRHEALEDALRTGVLVSSGDRLQFAHHVLFDHAAGRFYLAWDDANRLRAQVTEDPAIGLLLGPSLKFALERVWRDDTSGRPNTWALTLAIASAQGIDPVVAAAMTHYQFEALHPFYDGNGRVGRLLVVMQLLYTEVLTEPTLSVSPWFEARRSEYYDRLFGVSTRGDWDQWVAFFSRGLEASAVATHQQMLQLLAVRDDLLERVEHSTLRSATALRLVDLSVSRTSFTVKQ
ncbi:MAG: Fic family protein, partial [Oxalobacteraceae bacterium]